MTADQIRCVRLGYALIEPDAPDAFAMFYCNLFAGDPALRPLFKGDMLVQSERLMDAVGRMLDLLDRPAELQLLLHRLGARHRGFGVRSEHFDSVGRAMARTLEQALGAAFDTGMRQAWAALHDLIARTMLDGLQAGAARPAEAVALH